MTTKTLRRFPGNALIGSALLMAACAAVAATPTIQTGPTAEITADGLYRVNDSVMKMAWAKADLDLSGYTRIMVLPAGMTFKNVDRFSNTEYAVTEEQKAALQKTVLEVFGKELGKAERYAVTNEPGPGVLQVHGAMLDIVSRVPPERIGRGATILRSIGEATLVVELRDSVTGEVLARAAERRDVSSAFPRKSSKVNNTAEVREAARRWAGDLRQQLEEFEQL